MLFFPGNRVQKIFLIIPTLTKGGAERVVSLLSQEFERMDYEVKIVVFNNKVEYKYGGEIININAPASSNYFVKLLRLFQRTFRLKRIFKKENPDYIFSFTESANFPCILTGKKIIISIHTNPSRNCNRLQKIFIRFLYKFSNVKKVVAVSKEIEKILNRDYRLKNTFTIYNPVVIDDRYKIQEDLSEYQPYILSVGRLEKPKNFEMLIKAYSKTKANKEAKLLIIGEGSQKQELEKLIHNLNLEGKVFLPGKKDNIRDYYLQSEIYVLSSKYEGFPMVLVEALSNRCACIATNCETGSSEIIKSDFNGLLVENENEDALAEAIDRLYFDEALKNKFKNNAQKSIEHLKLEEIAKKWLEI